MLIKMDHSGKTKSVYKCDRCGKILDTAIDIRYKVLIDRTEQKSSYLKRIKHFDLCKKCTILLCKAIDKGVKHE